MSMTITHPGGEREITSYTIRSSARPFARSFEASPERYAVDGVIARGDGREVPNPLVVMLTITGDSLSAAYAEAYVVLAEAEVATEVVTYQGARGVQGVLGARFGVRKTEVELTLEFAPTGPWLAES